MREIGIRVKYRSIEEPKEKIEWHIDYTLVAVILAWMSIPTAILLSM